MSAREADPFANDDSEPRDEELLVRLYRVLFGFSGLGAGAYGFLRAIAKVLGVTVRFESVGGIDLDPDACEDFRRLTKSPALCADIAALTSAELRAFAGNRAPDAAFTSAPCVGASGLLSEAKAAEPKYQALNQLALVWTRLMLETWAEPPRLLIYENVPGIVRRAAGMLKELRKTLKKAGYVLHEGTHDCGEIGGLAQHRKRWLLVARRPASVPALLYQPVKRRVRGVGEVLGSLPMPGDPVAGPLHRLPRVSWLTWVRLALIPAGGDWRDLPEKVALPSASKHAHSNVYHVNGWNDPAACVTGGAAPSNGGQSIGDPRLHDALARPNAHRNMYRVVQWDQASGSVIGATRPGSGSMSVSDPRMYDPAKHSRPFNPSVHGVLRWDEPSHVVTGTTGSPGNGPFSVADPRVSSAPFGGSLGIMPWNAPSGTVPGESAPSNGRFSVADPRCARGYNGSYGVGEWTDASGVVTGAEHPSKGRFSIADPRLGCEPRNGVYGIVPWTAPSGAVTASMQHDNDEASVADPRIPEDWRDPPSDPPPVIVALDGTWHRPMTTLELAVLQGLPTHIDGKPLTLTAKTEARRRMHIGNAVPVGAGEAIARQMLITLAYSDAGTWSLSGEGTLWVDRAGVQ